MTDTKVVWKWYVYELVDPRDNNVFYVGKGSGKRINAHGLASDTNNTHKANKIKKIGYSNVIRIKIAWFHDEQEAYKFESDRICELFNLGNLTNLSIATTLAKRKREPIFTLSYCLSYLKVAGWVLAFPPSKYDYTIPDKSHTLPNAFSQSCYDTASDILRCLVNWGKLGKTIPSKIASRNVTIDLGALSV